jgi:hypothetical protein
MPDNKDDYYCAVCGKWLPVEIHSMFSNSDKKIIVIQPCCASPELQKQLDELIEFKNRVDKLSAPVEPVSTPIPPGLRAAIKHANSLKWGDEDVE